jgi:hypothetical protein
MFNTNAYQTSLIGRIAFIAGFAGLAAVIIFLNVSKRIKNNKIFKSGSVEIKKTSPEEEAYQKRAASYQLQRGEIKFLRDIMRSSRDEPAEILGDKKLLDEVLKPYYKSKIREAERSKPALNELVKLFQIRNVIAYFHAGNVPNNQVARRQVRKEVKFQGEVTLVDELKAHENGKTVKKFVLTQTKFKCVILDISAGGCAFEATANIKAGVKLKIDFTVTGNQKASALGELIRINKNQKATIFHVRFLKIMPRSYCTINAYIFGYD